MQPICVCAVRGFSCTVAELSSWQCWRALLYGSLKKIADPLLCRNLGWMLTSGFNLEPTPGQVKPMVLSTFTPSFAILVCLRHVCSLRLYLWKPFLVGRLSWSIEPPLCCTWSHTILSPWGETLPRFCRVASCCLISVLSRACACRDVRFRSFWLRFSLISKHGWAS